MEQQQPSPLVKHGNAAFITSVVTAVSGAPALVSSAGVEWLPSPAALASVPLVLVPAARYNAGT